MDHGWRPRILFRFASLVAETSDHHGSAESSATRFVPEERTGFREHARETLRLPSRQDPLRFLATSSSLLLVNAGLDHSRVRSDRSKLSRAVVDHEVCVYGGIEVGDVECHGTGTVRIHRIRAVDAHRADVAV